MPWGSQAMRAYVFVDIGINYALMVFNYVFGMDCVSVVL